MEIVEVISKINEEEFLELHCQINRSNPNWVQPLNNDVSAVFNPSQNKLFKEGKAHRWLLKDATKTIGRIAAFVNPKYTNKGDTLTVGGFGYFDCINSKKAASLLFDTAKSWLEANGCEAMDGPINFGERNKAWGLLVEGFQRPVYGLSYNPDYYKELFEAYGFKPFYSQYCYDIDLRQDLPRQLKPKFYEAHAGFSNDPSYYVKGLTKSNIREFSKDFCEIYNKAWASHEGGKTLSEEAAFKTFNRMKPIIKKHTSWIGYHNKRPVAMWVNMIDLNEVFVDFNGKFGWWQKLLLFYHLQFKPFTRLVGLVYGIIPEYQGTGVDRFVIVEGEKALKKHTNITKLELQWIGDFNPKMNAIARFLEAERSRELITYRYIFDRSVTFERHPIFN